MSSLMVMSVPARVAAYSVSPGQEVLVDPLRPVIYWAGADGDDLKFINSSTGDIIDSIVVGTDPTSICLSPDGTTLYVALPTGKCVVAVDADSHAIVNYIGLSFSPLSVRLDGNGFMYLSGAGDDYAWMYSVDMKTWKVKDSTSPGLGHLAIEISPDGTTLLAMSLGTSPIKIFRYGISSGVFSLINTDNHDLGDHLQDEEVDWTRNLIYLAPGSPYGLQLVTADSLDYHGVYPMDAYPSGVAMSGDGELIYGLSNGFTFGKVWVFDATDGSQMGSMSVGPSKHLAISHDLRSAYVGPPIQRINLTPIIEPIYPHSGSILGYTPTYFVVRFTGGLPTYDGRTAVAYVDATPLELSPCVSDWYGIQYKATFNQTLPNGYHNFSVALDWTHYMIWENTTFIIDKNSSQAIRPMLSPGNPPSSSVRLVEPLTISASIVYVVYEWIVQGGWITFDGENMTTVITPESLSVSHPMTPSQGWHNVSAFIYWDNGQGSASISWGFKVMVGPVITPLYPATDQILTDMPDHIEVAIDYGDTGGIVTNPQFFLDNSAIKTVITPNGTMVADVSPLTKAGYHEVRATLDWLGGRAVVDWEFYLDMFIGPRREVLTYYKYKKEFSLLVPVCPYWTLEADAELSGSTFPLVMYGPNIGNFRTNIIVESGSDDAVEESKDYLEEQLDQALEGLERSGMNATIVGSPGLRTVSNHSAYVATIQLVGYSVYQKIAIIASEEHQRIWIIILSISMSEFYTYGSMFDRMIESFEIEIRPGSTLSNLEKMAIGLGIAAIAGGASGAFVWYTRKRRGPASPPQP